MSGQTLQLDPGNTCSAAKILVFIGSTEVMFVFAKAEASTDDMLLYTWQEETLSSMPCSDLFCLYSLYVNIFIM